MDRETKQFLKGVGTFSGIIAVICLIGNKVGGAAPPEPALQLLQAQWDKDVYSPGENALLTAAFMNPTDVSWEYTTFMRYTDPSTGEPVRIEQTFALDPGQQKNVSYSCIAPSSTRFVYIEVNCNDKLIRTHRAPDLVVSVPTPEAFFIMLGGVNNEETWKGDKYTGYYTKVGTVKNVGDTEGSWEVIGWWRVGNYGKVHDARKVTITLSPGEQQEIAYTISAAEMLAAQEEAGHSIEHPYFILAFISTPGYAKYYTDQGWSYTSDVVHIPEG